MNNMYILARAPGGQMRGAATQAMQRIGDDAPSSRSGNKADARPPPRPFGLLPASPLAALLAPHILPGMLVARALPAGLGAAAKCKRYSLTGPKLI